MSPLGGWLLTPLLLSALCTGLGLLVERASAVTLPGALVPGAGLAALIVLAGVPVALGRVAPAAFVLASALAAAGFVLGEPWHDPRLRAAGPAALTAAVVYALYAAPSLASGQGSIAGWTTLDDSATWLALTEHVLAHGRAIHGAATSHDATLAGWLPSGYPVGSLLPLGIAAKLSGQDLANAYPAVVAVYTTILALGLRACVRAAGVGRWSAVAVAVAASQASLLYGYAQIGGIKEVCTAALLPVAAWCALEARAARSAMPVLLTAGALAGALGTAGAVWFAPALAVAVVSLWRARPLLTWPTAAALVAVLAASALPVLETLRFMDQTLSHVGTDQSDLGVLNGPLRLLQGAGLWPAPDFRNPPPSLAAGRLLAGGGLLAAVATATVLARRRAAVLPVLVGVAALGAAAAVVVGSPWIDAKALAIASGVLLAATATGAALAVRAPSGVVRAGGTAVACAVAAACAWSTLAVARDARVASRDSMDDLHAIGRQVRGAGPTLQLDPDPYGDRWFLRRAGADGVTDLRYRSVADNAGRPFVDGTPVDVEAIAIGDLARYRTLVRRRSPVAGTPPSAFVRLVARRRWEAWTRDPAAPWPVARLALGTPLAPAAPVPCGALVRLVHGTAARRLVAQPRVPPVVAGLQRGTLAAGWHSIGSVAVPATDGTSLVPVVLPRAGTWGVWVGGSTFGTVTVYLDGHAVGSARHELFRGAGWLRYGQSRLRAGRHTVAIRYHRGHSAGRHGAGDQAPLGPVALTLGDDAAARPVSVPAARWRSLCDGRPYDWVELYR